MAKTWSQKLAEMKSLKSKGAALVYDRIKLAVDVYGDDEFMADCQSRDESPDGFMDAEFGDVGATYQMLRTMLEYFPKKDSWEGKGIRQLEAEVLDAQAARRRDDASETTTRESWKSKAENLQRELESTRRELAAANAKVETLEKLVGGRIAA